MSDIPANADNVIDEQLVAYLDGELDAETSRQIEERLSEDPALRERLNALDRTWHVLDELEATPVDGTFTQSTLEMVTVAASEEVVQTQATEPVRQRRWRWLTVTSFVAAAAVGFLAVALSRPDPNRQLLEDLPVLENLDEYRQVQDFAFLERLHAEGLFTEEDSDGR